VVDTPVASLSTIRSPGTAFTRRRVGCVVGLALCAAGLVLLATRQGVPMESDDAVYAGVARTLASGEGLNVPFHYYPLGSVSIGTPPPGSTTPSLTPLVIYAPLEPVFLAIGGQNPVGTARVEASIFFALTVLLVGVFVLAVTGELWPAAAAQIVIGFSLANLVSFGGTVSAALFFTMVAFFAVVRYRDGPRPKWFVVGVLAIGLATLTRFAAGGLIVWSGLALRHRRLQALAFTLTSGLPLVGWFVYEKVSGRSTGHSLGFHVVKTTIRSGIHSVAFWILPTNSPTVVVVLGVLLVMAVLLILMRRNSGEVPRLLLLFAVVQIVILEIAITFFDAGVDLDSREFVPILLAVVLALACGMSRTTALKIVTVVLVAASALRFGLDDATQPPGGYTTPKWEHSPIVADVRALPAHTIIYTDAPDVLYLLAGRATSSIPETQDFSTLKKNPRFDAQIEQIRRTLSTRGGYVVYIRGLGRDSFLPTEATLRRLLSLHLVRNASDGAIYSIGGSIGKS
jgi:hypothetical protein